MNRSTFFHKRIRGVGRRNNIEPSAHTSSQTTDSLHRTYIRSLSQPQSSLIYAAFSIRRQSCIPQGLEGSPRPGSCTATERSSPDPAMRERGQARIAAKITQNNNSRHHATTTTHVEEGAAKLLACIQTDPQLMLKHFNRVIVYLTCRHLNGVSDTLHRCCTASSRAATNE